MSVGAGAVQETSALTRVLTTTTGEDRHGRAEDPDPGAARGNPYLRAARGPSDEHRAGAADDRSPDGGGRVRHARRPLRRPHGRHLRSARGRAQPAPGRGHRRDARGARRGPPPADRCAGRRAGRHLRQQRRGRERARARRPPSRAGAHARRARAAAGHGACGSRPRAGGLRGHPCHLRAPGSRPGDGEGHRLHEPPGADPARFSGPPQDPAAFDLPSEDDGARDHTLLGSHIILAPRYEPEFESLRRASTRIVVAGGAESEGTFPYRAGAA
jgi:hypothetical protein